MEDLYVLTARLYLDINRKKKALTIMHRVKYGFQKYLIESERLEFFRINVNYKKHYFDLYFPKVVAERTSELEKILDEFCNRIENKVEVSLSYEVFYEKNR